MNPCPNCGAQVSLDALECPFCHSATKRGVELKDAELRREEEARAAATAQAAKTFGDTLKKSADQAFVWSLVGLACCAVPFPALVALVLARRSTREAREKNIPVPSRLALANVLGWVGLAIGVAVWIGAAIQLAGEHRRAQELRTTLDQTAAAATLDQATACALVELRLLERGYGTFHGARQAECAGKLSVEGEKARLGEVVVRIPVEGKSREERVTACFARGERWLVTDLVEGSPSDACGLKAP